MTAKQNEYMRKWGSFYRDLYYGRKKPTTIAQRDFIKHVKMSLGTNEHERAFLAWLGTQKKKIKQKPSLGHAKTYRRPGRSRKDATLAWMKKEPIPPPPLPEPIGTKGGNEKPDYDKLASGKAHGDKKRRMRERQLDRWGRPTDN